jgi:hypothetical protein
MWKYANLLVDDDLGDLAAARSLNPGYLMLQSITNMRGSTVDLKRFPASPRRRRSTFFLGGFSTGIDP